MSASQRADDRPSTFIDGSYSAATADDGADAADGAAAAAAVVYRLGLRGLTSKRDYRI